MDGKEGRKEKEKKKMPPSRYYAACFDPFPGVYSS